MVQTQVSVEDRLAAMESAGAALAATFAARHNELASQMANLQLQMSNISEGILQSLVEQQKTHQSFAEEQKTLQDINTEQQKAMQEFIGEQQKAMQGLVEHQNTQQDIISEQQISMQSLVEQQNILQDIIAKQQNTMQNLVEQQKAQQDIGKEQKTLQSIIAEHQNTLQYLVKQQNIQKDKIDKEQKPLQDLIEQQKVLETKFDMILDQNHKRDINSEPLLEREENIKQCKDASASPQVRQGYYVNWEEKHDYLLQGLYVWFEDLKEILTRLTHYDSAPETLINMLKTPFKVDKTTRFPPFGLFVNVNNQLIKHEIGEIVFAIKKGRSLTNYESCIDKLLSRLNYLYTYKKVYNVTSYEAMCKLKWADVTEYSRKQDNIIKACITNSRYDWID